MERAVISDSVIEERISLSQEMRPTKPAPKPPKVPTHNTAKPAPKPPKVPTRNTDDIDFDATKPPKVVPKRPTKKPDVFITTKKPRVSTVKPRKQPGNIGGLSTALQNAVDKPLMPLRRRRTLSALLRAQALGLSDLSRRLHTAVLCSAVNRADKVRLRWSRSVKTRRGCHRVKMGGPGPNRDTHRTRTAAGPPLEGLRIFSVKHPAAVPHSFHIPSILVSLFLLLDILIKSFFLLFANSTKVFRKVGQMGMYKM
ncbi:unnamed protein product [Ranitomeya imitator]|uniref:Uncharacterized protein n=1 Tax=Ranitomeya imitator TaxID=111125 RepID=A0ABN9L760_9NEOB|nr:unnamed protein product [Ranitomeya imitator]